MKKDELRAMSRLIDEFGADVLVNLQPPKTKTPRERAADRCAAEDAASLCTACGLCDLRMKGDQIGPDYPSVTGPIDLAVVVPFPSSGGYHRMLKNAVSDHVSLSRVAFIPVTGCTPREAGGTVRKASAIEVKACRPNLHWSLDATGAPNVLLVGTTALWAWRPDLKLEQVLGMVGVWKNTHMVATVGSPTTANTSAEKKEWVRDTSRAVHRLLGEEVGGFGERCIHKGCQRPVKGWDSDALPWCDQHINVRDKVLVPSYTNERLW